MGRATYFGVGVEYVLHAKALERPDNDFPILHTKEKHEKMHMST